jgi:hypothetical protein
MLCPTLLALKMPSFSTQLQVNKVYAVRKQWRYPIGKNLKTKTMAN